MLKKLFCSLLIVSLFISVSKTVKIYAEDKIMNLQSITLVEHVFIGTYDTSEDIIENAKILNGEENFLLISLPHRFNEPILSTSDTQYRGDLYCQPIQAIPVIAVDGVVDPRDKDSTSHWPEVIKTGIKNHSNMADFSLQLLPSGQYQINALGKSDELSKYKKLALTVILYQDWVTCAWDNGDTTVRNLARKFPMGAWGQYVNIKKDQLVVNRFDIVIPDEYRNLYGIVALLQDLETNKIFASSYGRLADVEKPAYFSWNNWPKATYDLENQKLLDLYFLKTGVSEMVFMVKNANDLKLIQLELDYRDAEKSVYDILGCVVNPELKQISTLTFDLEKKKINIYFSEPIIGDKKLFSLVVHWKKQNLETSSNFKVKSFYAYNSKNNVVCFDLNDIRQYYPNMLLITTNPLDFNEDSWIDDKDLLLMIPHFGFENGEKDYDPKFDINQTDQKKRIDILDILSLISEVNLQDSLIKSSK